MPQQFFPLFPPFIVVGPHITQKLVICTVPHSTSCTAEKQTGSSFHPFSSKKFYLHFDAGISQFHRSSPDSLPWLLYCISFINSRQTFWIPPISQAPFIYFLKQPLQSPVSSVSENGLSILSLSNQLFFLTWPFLVVESLFFHVLNSLKTWSSLSLTPSFPPSHSVIES